MPVCGAMGRGRAPRGEQSPAGAGRVMPAVRSAVSGMALGWKIVRGGTLGAIGLGMGRCSRVLGPADGAGSVT